MMPEFMQNKGKYFYDTLENPRFPFTIDINGHHNHYNFADFHGVIVTSIDGIIGMGEPKNVLKEEVVNSGRSDVFVPETVYTKSTEININFMVTDAFIVLKYPNEQISLITFFNRFLSVFIGRKVWIYFKDYNITNQFIGLKECKPSIIQLGRQFGQNRIVGKLILERIHTPDISDIR